jgi:hypothetical protein
MSGRPSCGTNNEMILMAQAVPAATAVPCVASLPAGWSVGGMKIHRNRGTFWLNSDRAGDRAVQATLLPEDACSVTGATEVPSDEAGMRRFERIERLPPRLRSLRYYLLPGGCVTYEFDLEGQTTAALFFAADSALAFQPRSELVAKVRHDVDLSLCGAGAPCPGGSR